MAAQPRHSVPAEETVGAFGELVASGEVGLLGVSNHWSWRVERARSVAAALGVSGYEVLQYHYSYLRPRADLPGRDSVGAVQEDLLTLVRGWTRRTDGRLARDRPRSSRRQARRRG